ncbi:hypothetical protein EVAR_41140_1 [Eumeta japonica]|uniref:Uncharacterized protein n=1 Tax=Eumeta variegata TaxID=151549 RepID=A0A4C1YD74_EUMVA|nr:hypothetical protein EVAR_41140_1 [Eumeta japonica]
MKGRTSLENVPLTWGVGKDGYNRPYGLVMEPESKHRNSMIYQCILAVFDLVENVLRCTLTMSGFHGLMMKPEAIRPVPHNMSLPTPVSPTSFNIDDLQPSTSSQFNFNDDDDSHSKFEEVQDKPHLSRRPK